MSAITKIRRAKQGMTLVEVMVTLGLLAMVMGGAYGMIVQAQKIGRTARNHYVASNLAKNRLERARNFQYSDLSLMSESNVRVDENGAAADEGRFRRTTLVNSAYAAGLTRILVTVEIGNIRTGQFTGEKEVIESLFTDYITGP